MSILETLAKWVVVGATSIGLIATPVSPNLGTAVPTTPALIDTYLASSITSSATSMTLADGTTRSGTSLSGFMCFVVDVNQPTTEYICGTASGTTVSSLSRGIDPLNPNTTSSALAYSHRRFASVQVSDYPTIQFLVRKANGTEAYDSPLLYSFSSTSSISTSSTIPNRAYVDSVATAGCANGQEGGTRGCVEPATQSQMANGSSIGGSGAALVLQSKYSNSTSSATTTIVVTNSSGKIAPDSGFISTSTDFSFRNQTLSILTSTSTATSTDMFNLLPAGVIQMYASSSAPGGWLLADGSEYATSSYPRLWQVIQYVYGGSTSTFRVPDLRGRFVTSPSSTISTTIGATGGTVSSTLSGNSVFSGWTQVFATGGPGTGVYGPTASSGNIPLVGSATSTPPYIVLNHIIKY